MCVARDYLIHFSFPKYPVPIRYYTRTCVHCSTTNLCISPCQSTIDTKTVLALTGRLKSFDSSVGLSFESRFTRPFSQNKYVGSSFISQFKDPLSLMHGFHDISICKFNSSTTCMFLSISAGPNSYNFSPKKQRLAASNPWVRIKAHGTFHKGQGRYARHFQIHAASTPVILQPVAVHQIKTCFLSISCSRRHVIFQT
jgi:hypothetical protein